MSRRLLPPSHTERRGVVPPLWRDLKAGRVGWPVLIGLGLAVAAALGAAMTFFFGVVEAYGGRVRDPAYALGFAICGAIWCPVLVWLLTRRRQGRRWIKATVGVVGVWIVTIPLTVFLDQAIRRADLLMVACVFAGICATIVILAGALHGGGGRPLEDREGAIRVTCPGCNYSMVGLESCTCPECGENFTIDQLIRGQDYAALRPNGFDVPALPPGETRASGAPQA